MKVIPNTLLICYADENMTTSQQLCLKSAKERGCIERVSGYTPDYLFSDMDFCERNTSVLEATQRGGGKGWWLWKPYIVEDTVRKQPLGEYVIYADSGVEFISSIEPIIKQMERSRQDIFLFGNGHPHLKWCKSKVFKSMLPDWFNLPNLPDEQVQASVMIFKVTPFTRQFVREWLAWCEIPGFIDDSDNVGITPDYSDHRNDQAILTNLAIKYKLPLHWWPVQYGHVLRNNYQLDKYGQLFYHHRYRENEWKACGLTIEQFMQQPKS